MVGFRLTYYDFFAFHLVLRHFCKARLVQKMTASVYDRTREAETCNLSGSSRVYFYQTASLAGLLNIMLLYTTRENLYGRLGHGSSLLTKVGSDYSDVLT